MKNLWNIVSFLAVVHLLALALFIAWLWQSQRLSAERIQAARVLFAPTLSQEEAVADEEAAESEARRREAEAEAQRLNPGIPSGVALTRLNTLQVSTEQTLRRLEDEKRLLENQLVALKSTVALERAAFDEERANWDQSIADEKRRRTDEQFTKATKLLEGLPAKSAKQQILSMVQQGQINEAVAYLNAMNPRAATAILKEFKEPAEIQLATELLERLRRFGLVPDETSEPTYADNAAADPDGPPDF